MTTTQVFIRFDREPGSILVDCPAAMRSAEQVADMIAAFLSVPIVYDPIVCEGIAIAGRSRISGGDGG